MRPTTSKPAAKLDEDSAGISEEQDVASSTKKQSNFGNQIDFDQDSSVKQQPLLKGSRRAVPISAA